MKGGQKWRERKGEGIGMRRMGERVWWLTWRKELHVEDEVVHLLGRLLAVLVIPSEMERLDVLLLEGVGSLHHTADSLPPVLLGSVVEGAGVGSAVDQLAERLIAKWGRDGLVLLEEVLAEFETKVTAHDWGNYEGD